MGAMWDFQEGQAIKDVQEVQEVQVQESGVCSRRQPLGA